MSSKGVNRSFLKNDVAVCDSYNVQHLKLYIQHVITFLKEAKFLTEAYILDYFVESLWSRLPSGWLEVLQTLDIHDLERFLNHESEQNYKQPWPLSLLSMRAASFALALPRKSLSSLDPVNEFLCNNSNAEVAADSCSDFKSSWNTLADEFEEKSGQHIEIPEFCRRHVKPKKQHEIFRLAQLTDLIAKRLKLKHVIDVGSGQGHLSRFLALCYDLKLTTVEANLDHISGATKFDLQALSALERDENRRENSQNNNLMFNFDEASLPFHVRSSLNMDSSETSLREVLKKALCQTAEQQEAPPPPPSQEPFALVGLHTCGNLAETVVKTFAEDQQAQAMLSVGCCYMKLEPNGGCEGYPLSAYVKSIPSHGLSYEAREMACHALEMYIERLHEDAPALKIHCYRATLEACIVRHHPGARRLGLRGVKRAEYMQFYEYADSALCKTPLTVPMKTLRAAETEECLSRWKEVLAFYSVRLLTAPVVESLIIADRLLYLHEQGHVSCVAPIFDPSLSPRNQIILSVKCQK